MVLKSFFPILLTTALLFPALSMSSESTANLRNRIQVLAQAKDKATAELTLKQQQGTAGEQDVAHYQTVSRFLDQQTDQACKALADKGAITTDLPCSPKYSEPLPKKTPKNPVAEKQPVPEPDLQPAQPEIVKPVQQTQQVQEIKPEPVAQKIQKTSQKEKPAGFFATIAQWLKSLFMPKPPPSAPSVPTSSSRQTETQDKSQQKTPQSAKNQPADQQNTPTSTGSKSSDQSKQNTRDKEQKLETSQKKATGSAANKQKNTDKLAGGTQSVHEKKSDTGKVKSGGEKAATSFKKSPDSSQQHDSLTGKKKNTLKESGIATKSGRKKTDIHGRAVNSVGQKKKQQGVAKKNTSPGQGTKNKQPKKTNAHKATGTENGPANKPAGLQGGTAGRKMGVNRLEQSLNDALGEFDGTLLSAQEKLSRRIPSRREQGKSGEYGATGFEPETADQPLEEQNTNNTTNPGGVAASGGKIKPGSGRTSIGADDDIVARQLREAAEKEKDPVLQEKLWKEYRKYKAGM